MYGFRNAKRAPRQFLSGFSILEVLITAAIIGIITAIITLKYGSFNNLILLKNQAYQMAIDLREMQSRSLSAIGDSTQFRLPYGVYFTTSNPDQYIVFLDSDEDGVYDNGEALEIRKLDSRFRLNRICRGTTSSCTSLSQLSVTFRRPNFDAVMYSNLGAESGSAVVEIETVTESGTRAVNINPAGQITVQ